MLQFSMHASLIHANITVGVPTLQLGFDADATKSIQERRALVGVIIIIIIIIIIISVVISVICLKCHCVLIFFHQWKVLIHAVLQLVFGNVFIEVSKRLGFTDNAVCFHVSSGHSFEHGVSRNNNLKPYVTQSW